MATIPAIPPLKNNERLNVNTPSLAPNPAGKKKAKKPMSHAIANEPIRSGSEASTPSPNKMNLWANPQRSQEMIIRKRATQ